jgi:hypothetical protein
VFGTSWQDNKNQFMKNIAIIVGGSVLVIFVFVRLIVTIYSAVNGTNLFNQAPSPQPVSNITWEDIDKVFSNSSRRTDLQKNEQWKMFQGQRVRWAGKVHSINDDLTLLVQVGFNLFYDVRIHLAPSQRAIALNLKPGDTITFEATLKRWGAGNSWSPHTLGDGIIVSTPPQPGNQKTAGDQLAFDNPPKGADQGVGKLAAFKKVVAKLDAHPGQFAGQAQLDIYANELRSLFDAYEAIPFDPRANRAEATEIVQLFKNRVSGRFNGREYRLIEASAVVMENTLRQ